MKTWENFYSVLWQVGGGSLTQDYISRGVRSWTLRTVSPAIFSLVWGAQWMSGARSESTLQMWSPHSVRCNMVLRKHSRNRVLTTFTGILSTSHSPHSQDFLRPEIQTFIFDEIDWYIPQVVLFCSLTLVESVTLADVIYQRLRDILAEEYQHIINKLSFAFYCWNMYGHQLEYFLFIVNIVSEVDRTFF